MRSKSKWLQVRSSPVEAELYKAAALLSGSGSTSEWVREQLARSAAEAAEIRLEEAAEVVGT